MDATLKVCGRIKQAVWISDRGSLYAVQVWAAVQEQKRQREQHQQQHRGREEGDEAEAATACHAWDGLLRNVVAHGFADTDETVGKWWNVWCLELGVTGPTTNYIVGLILIEKEQVYSRVGMYKGNSTMTSWFDGIKPKEIYII
jgi:hypothetical protein